VLWLLGWKNKILLSPYIVRAAVLRESHMLIIIFRTLEQQFLITTTDENGFDTHVNVKGKRIVN